MNFIAYPVYFLSLITTIRQKKKAWDWESILTFVSPRMLRIGGGSDLFICWGKGKGKGGRESGSSGRLGECETGRGRLDEVWSQGECETETKSPVGWGWSPGRVGIGKEKRLWDRDEVKFFAFLILHLVRWHLG